LFEIPCLPTISATCSELGTGTHSVMLALLRLFDELCVAVAVPNDSSAVEATIGPRLPVDDDDDADDGEEVTADRPRTGDDPIPFSVDGLDDVNAAVIMAVSAADDTVTAVADDKFRFTAAKFTRSCRANCDAVVTAPPVDDLGAVAKLPEDDASW